MYTMILVLHKHEHDFIVVLVKGQFIRAVDVVSVNHVVIEKVVLMIVQLMMWGVCCLGS